MQLLAEFLFDLVIDYLPDEKEFTRFNTKYWLHVVLGLILTGFTLLFVSLFGFGLHSLFFSSTTFSIKMALVALVMLVLALFIGYRTALYLQALGKITKKLRR